MEIKISWVFLQLRWSNSKHTCPYGISKIEICFPGAESCSVLSSFHNSRSFRNEYNGRLPGLVFSTRFIKYMNISAHSHWKYVQMYRRIVWDLLKNPKKISPGSCWSPDNVLSIPESNCIIFVSWNRPYTRVIEGSPCRAIAWLRLVSTIHFHLSVQLHINE